MDNSLIESQLREILLRNADIIGEGLPDFMNLPRESAMSEVERLGLPTRRVERYRMTDVRALYEGDYEKYFIPTVSEKCCSKDIPFESFHFQTCNGFAIGEDRLTVLENGVVFGSLAEAARRFPQIVARYFNAQSIESEDAVANLNTAFVQDGFFLYVPKNQQVERPIYVLNSFYADEDIWSFSRNLVVLEPGAQAHIVYDYRSASESAVLNNTVSEYFVAPNARAEFVEIDRQNSVSNLITTSFVYQDRGSHCRSVTLTLDGNVVRNNMLVKMLASGCENHTYGLALGSGTQHFDNFTDLQHLSPDCNSFENYKNIAADHANVIFNGRIYVSEDSQRTQAFQENRNLLLSDTAEIHTKPQLEIYADDVKCSHGSTIGQLDTEAIYYMRQRGIPDAEARRLQVYGFVNEIVKEVGNEELAEFLDHVATRKIESL